MRIRPGFALRKAHDKNSESSLLVSLGGAAETSPYGATCSCCEVSCIS